MSKKDSKRTHSTASIPEPVLSQLQEIAEKDERSVSFYATKFSREMLTLMKEVDLKEVNSDITVFEVDGQSGKCYQLISNVNEVLVVFNEATLRSLTQKFIQLTLKAENDAKGK